MRRKIDPLNRVVIPKYMVRQLDLEPGDELNIVLNDGKVIISRKNNKADLKSMIAHYQQELERLEEKENE